LLEALATQVWQVSDGRLSVFRYGFAEYRRRVSQSTSDTEKPSTQKELKIRQPEAKGDKYQDKKKKERLRVIEEKIENAEGKLSEIEKLLLSASQQGDKEKIAELGQQHSALKQEIQEQMQAWEDTAEGKSQKW
jgi:chromosome segregation ATPase